MNTKLVKLSLIYSLIISVPAMAYIDPGSGHLLIQLVLGFAVGSLFFVKRAAQIAKDTMKRVFSGGKTVPEDKHVAGKR